MACVELGANVALFDILEEPLETLGNLEKDNGFKFQYHQYVSDVHSAFRA